MSPKKHAAMIPSTPHTEGGGSGSLAIISSPKIPASLSCSERPLQRVLLLQRLLYSCLNQRRHDCVAGRQRMNAVFTQRRGKPAPVVFHRRVVVNIYVALASSITLNPLIQCCYLGCGLQSRAPGVIERRQDGA